MFSERFEIERLDYENEFNLVIDALISHVKEIFEEEWGEKEREYKYHIIDLEDKLNGSTSYSLHDDSTLDTQLETIKSEYKNKFQDLLMKIYELADDEWENRSNEYQKTIRELEQEIDDLNEELQSKYEDDEDHGADFY